MGASGRLALDLASPVLGLPWAIGHCAGPVGGEPRLSPFCRCWDQPLAKLKFRSSEKTSPGSQHASGFLPGTSARGTRCHRTSALSKNPTRGKITRIAVITELAPGRGRPRRAHFLRPQRPRSAPTAPDSPRALKGRRFWGATRRRPLSRS